MRTGFGKTRGLRLRGLLRLGGLGMRKRIVAQMLVMLVSLAFSAGCGPLQTAVPAESDAGSTPGLPHPAGSAAAAVSPQATFEETGAAHTTDAGILAFGGMHAVLPDGWKAAAVPVGEQGRPAGQDGTCSGIRLEGSTGLVVLLEPDCGYADAGPVDCAEDLVLIYEEDDGGGIGRWYDTQDGVHRYSTVGIATGAGEGGEVLHKQVCYFPAVVGLPAGESMVILHVSVLLGESEREKELLSQVDELLLSFVADPSAGR